jgi:biofilm PGA synthesis N-glycosyltransferase PgaC
VSRLFDALTRIDYPKDKIEIVFVEDGSSDNTFEVCQNLARVDSRVKVVQQTISSGKPSALNFGLSCCCGDIIAVFDADNVPAEDSLRKVVRYFNDEKVAAVQGRTMSINSQENMLTQFLSYEDAVWCEAYLRGKDALKLFVHLKGSCQFFRRSVLQRLSGFDEQTLSEDMEISARLTEGGYGIRYAGDVCSWQESVSTLKGLFRQRTRWFRGTMEVAFKYGRLMDKPSWRNFDAEATLFGPFIVIASLFSYVAGSGAFFSEYPFDMVWHGFMYLSLASTTIMVLLVGAILIFISRPKRALNLLWLPFVFAYWAAQAFIAFYAALLILLQRPKRWTKTEKTGNVSEAFALNMEQEIDA